MFQAIGGGGVIAPRYSAFLYVTSLLNCAIFARAARDLNDAVKLGSVTQVASLLAEGAPVSSRDNIGWTPLHNAANTGSVDVAKLLLNHQPDVNAKDIDYGITALHLAAKNGEEEVTEALLKAGASSNITDIRGQTPLHLAAWNGHLNTTLLLLEHGADINARDEFGSTPLRLAMIQDYENIVRAILTVCPDLRLPDIKGVTVVEFAKEKGLKNIVSILEDHRRLPCSRYKLRQNVVEQFHLIYDERCPRGDMEFPDEDIPYHWKLKEAARGRTTEIPCPAGSSGTAAWVCRRDGKWHRTPDLSKCYSLFFSGWQEVMATENITAAEIVTEVVTSLKDAEKGITLAPGDLLAIGERLVKLQGKHQQDLGRMTSGIKAWRLAMKYLKGIIDLVDLMLSKPALWWGLNHEVKYVAFTQLQDSVKFAMITLAFQQLGSYQEFAVGGLTTRVMNRPVSYYKSILLSFDHPGFNQTLLSLPYNFYETFDGDQGALKVTFVAYNDLHCAVNAVPCSPSEVVPERDLPALSQVNTPIVGATIGDGMTWDAPEDEMVVIKFQHIYTGDKYHLGKPICVWWDVTSHTWATDGCYLVRSDYYSSVCHCNHLTNIAVVMDIHGIIDSTGAMHRVMRCVTIVGCVVAIVSLILCIVCFLAFKDIREKSTSIILANLCFCIMLSEMVLLGGLGTTYSNASCTVVAGFLHYLFLATFIWNAIDAFHMYIKSKIFRTKTSPLKYYLIAGYLLPVIYIIFIIAFGRVKGFSNDKVCWLTTQALIWSFTGPLAAILLFNVLVFLTALYSSWCKESQQSIESNYKRSTSSYSTSTKSTKSRDSTTEEVGFWGNLNRQKLEQPNQKKKLGGSSLSFQQSSAGKSSRKSSSQGSAEEVPRDPLGRKIGESVGVLVLLCLTWLCGFIYYLDGSHVLALIFTFLNSMQGVSIFVLQIVMNPNIMREVRSVLK